MNKDFSTNLDKSLFVRPVFSSKATDLGKHKQYAFLFKIKTTKPQAKRLIESIYEVKVDKVNIARYEGKSRAFGKFAGKKVDFKKVFVTLSDKSKEIQVLPGASVSDSKAEGKKEAKKE